MSEIEILQQLRATILCSGHSVLKLRAAKETSYGVISNTEPKFVGPSPYVVP